MADNNKNYLEFLELDDGSRWYAKDTEAQEKDVVVTCTSSGIPQTLSTSTYYNVTGAVSTMTLNLPVVTDNAHLSVIAVCFTTGSGIPSVTITSSNSATISYFSGYEIKASTTYELNIMWNGTKWIVAYATIE